MKKHPEFKNLYEVNHPLVLHKLSHMRDENCNKFLFRSLLKEISFLMAYEISGNMTVTTRKIKTPMTEMEAPFLEEGDVVIVPILRAGLGMSEGLEEIMPSACVGHVGLYRDEETKKPVEYLVKLPDMKGRTAILVDPMLATGHSAKYAIDVMVKNGSDPDKMIFMALVAAPEGVKVLEAAYPQIPVYVASLDSHLNEKAYIVPGLGDAGDRLFGTIA